MENKVEYTKVIKLNHNHVEAIIFREVNESKKKYVCRKLFYPIDVVNIIYSIFGNESKILDKQFKVADDWADSQMELLKKNEVFFIHANNKKLIL